MSAILRLEVFRSLAFAAALAMPTAGLTQVAEGEDRQGEGEEAPVHEPPTKPNAKSEDTSLPLYVPPSLGSPAGRLGGATRGSGHHQTVWVLAPDHIGLTTEVQPILYWYLDKSTQGRIDLTIRDYDAAEPLLGERIPAPIASGIHRIRLADYGVRLESGKNYRWFISLIPDQNRSLSEVVAGAWIRFAGASEVLSERLGSAPGERAVFVYAAGGIWYDAIASVSARIEAAPHNAALRAQRAALLEQVGLSGIAAFDRAQAGIE